MTADECLEAMGWPMYHQGHLDVEFMGRRLDRAFTAPDYLHSLSDEKKRKVVGNGMQVTVAGAVILATLAGGRRVGPEPEKEPAQPGDTDGGCGPVPCG
jgi:hypothetical protein